VATLVELTKETVTKRVTELFPGDNPSPAVKPELPAIAGKPTKGLAMLTFDASKTIKGVKGLRAREEVGGYLFGDLLGIEILEPEALRLGENVRKAAMAAKDAESAIKNGASASKSQLKKKAQKDAELAARLQKALDDIDYIAAIACAELLQTAIEPKGLPDRNTAVVDSRPTKLVLATPLPPEPLPSFPHTTPPLSLPSAPVPASAPAPAPGPIKRLRGSREAAQVIYTCRELEYQQYNLRQHLDRLYHHQGDSMLMEDVARSAQPTLPLSTSPHPTSPSPHPTAHDTPASPTPSQPIPTHAPPPSSTHPHPTPSHSNPRPIPSPGTARPSQTLRLSTWRGSPC
jgi:hypothetical protein